MKTNLSNKKRELRKKQIDIRRKLSSEVIKVFNKSLFKELFKIIDLKNINIISSFISINSEIDTLELNNYILKINKILCLPTVIKKNKHLVFKELTNDSEMIEGFMKIKEPPFDSKILIPDLLFIPCLAYDYSGFRLGYGGGYYDRTLSFLKKKKKKFISVGYAFDGQKVSEVPKDKFDIKLDYVITEKKIYSFL